MAVRKNFCLLFTALSLSVVAAGLGRLRTGRVVGGFTGRLSSELSRMSSTSSSGVADFSGLGEKCFGCSRGALLKKDVMGLYTALGLAGDLAGDFLLDDAAALGDPGRRVCTHEAFASPRVPSLTLSSVPLLGRRGGGEREASSSDSEESTTGCFRAALGLAIPPRIHCSGQMSAAN